MAWHAPTHSLSQSVSSAIMTYYATLALTALTSALGLGVGGETFLWDPQKVDATVRRLMTGASK